MKRFLYFCIIVAALGLYSCSPKNEPENNADVRGMLPGKFSISEDRQVQFSQGNLQYQASTKTWRFADKQYDYIGNDNAKISDTYEGWIDLFGWGTGNNPTLSSTENSDYLYFIDWGNNTISNGGNKVKFWRTFDSYAWWYLFYKRTNANDLFGLGCVNGVNGTILLPDDWRLPGGMIFTPSRQKGLVDENDYMYNSNEDNYTHNIYTAEQWEIMESAGAVFLPAAGCRWGTYMDFVGNGGSYWTLTHGGGYDAYYLSYNVNGLSTQSCYGCSTGRSVRLVHYIE